MINVVFDTYLNKTVFLSKMGLRIECLAFQIQNQTTQMIIFRKEKESVTHEFVSLSGNLDCTSKLIKNKNNN